MISPVSSVLIDMFEPTESSAVIAENPVGKPTSTRVSFEMALKEANQAQQGQSDFVLDNSARASRARSMSEAAAVAHLSVELESLYMQEVFRSMRSTTKALQDSENALSHANDGMFADVLDAQLVSSLSKHSGGNGLAVSIYNQLSRMHGVNK